MRLDPNAILHSECLLGLWQKPGDLA